MTTTTLDPPTHLATVSANTTATKRERPREWPELIPQHMVYGRIGYVGISKAGWFRARAAGGAPKPVRFAGGGIYFRKADLDKWIAGLKAS